MTTKENKTLVLFDFDGTLTRKDSMFEFIRYAKGTKALLWVMLLNLPVLVGYKLGLIQNSKAKMRLLKTCFGGWSKQKLIRTGQDFSLEFIPTIIRPEALKKLNWHKREGHTIVIISASLDFWLRPWVKFVGASLISSNAQFEENVFAGFLDGPNCYGNEKVNRLKAAFELDTFDKIIAYGDSKGDKEMLELADEAHYKPFRN